MGKSKDRLTSQVDSKMFDTVIRHLMCTFPPEITNRVYCMDSLWFCNWTIPAFRSNVQKWIREGCDIFDKQYIFIPIIKWNHWYLLVICWLNDGFENDPIIFLLNSLRQLSDQGFLRNSIHRFVIDLFDLRGRTETIEYISTIPLLEPHVPQQKDDTSCGVFVLFYIYKFMTLPADKLNKVEYKSVLNANWFIYDEFNTFREMVHAIWRESQTIFTDLYEPTCDILVGNSQMQYEEFKKVKVIESASNEVQNDNKEEQIESQGIVAYDRRRKRKKKETENKEEETNTKKEVIFYMNRAITKDFVRFLGHDIVRNTKICPITVKSWKDIPDKDKESMWKFVCKKYKFEGMEERKNDVLSHIRFLWSNWRADLNRKYLKGKIPHVALAKVPDKLTKIEWEWLVKCYFSDPKYKKWSRQNKRNRESKRAMHRTGSKPFRTIMFEKGGAHGLPPNPAEMFYETRKKGDTLIDENSIKKHEELVAATLAEPHASHIEIIERCFGPRVHSHITCYGSGVKKKDMQQDPEKKILLEENLQLKKEIEKIKADIAAFKDLDIGALKRLIIQSAD